MTCPAPEEKSLSLASAGSVVARLKLKEIDGRAPPGVAGRIGDVKVESTVDIVAGGQVDISVQGMWLHRLEKNLGQ